MATSLAALAASGLGLAIGLRHALEPDHVVAIAAMVAPQRDPRSVLRYGAAWGIGHTVSLCVVGLVLTLARAAMPRTASLVFESLVAAMIVIIGVDTVRRGWTARRRSTNRAAKATLRTGPFTVPRGPLLAGMVHGLAGSGALTALAVSTLPTLASQILFMVLFGVGSAVGMAIAAGVTGWALARVAQAPSAFAALSVFAGVIAIWFGVIYGHPPLAELLSD